MGRAVRILVECPALIASVKIGVLEPLKPIEHQGKCEVAFKETIKITRKDIAWCDILICVRGCEFATFKIVQAAKRAGRFIIYFLDDDLLNVPSQVSSGDYFCRKDLKQNLIACIENSDILWCVNKLIGEKYSVYCNNNWVLSRVPAKITAIPMNEYGINILYAGSTDHEKNVQKYISPVVKKLCEEFKDIKFTFIGANPDLKNYSNVTYIKFIENYDEYKRLVNSVCFSIGIAIINTSEFYKYKYYNKFIEYTSIGAVGVYTKSEPYLSVIADKENGLLCDNNFNQWYNAIKSLIIDKDLREKCLLNARENLEKEFNHEIIAKNLEEKIPQLATFYTNEVDYKNVKLQNVKLYYYIGRLKLLIKKYGVLILFIIPIKILKKVLRVFKNKGN